MYSIVGMYTTAIDIAMTLSPRLQYSPSKPLEVIELLGEDNAMLGVDATPICWKSSSGCVCVWTELCGQIQDCMHGYHNQEEPCNWAEDSSDARHTYFYIR